MAPPVYDVKNLLKYDVEILDARYWLLDTPILSSIVSPSIRVYSLHKFTISNYILLRLDI